MSPTQTPLARRGNVPASPRSERGFTRLELVVTLACLATLLACAVPSVLGNGVKSARAVCLGNLRQIGVAFQAWAAPNGERYPWMVQPPDGGSYQQSSAYWHFLVASNELGSPRILVCPADPAKTSVRSWEFFNNNNLSYFVSLHHNGIGRDQALLSGDRNVVGNGYATCAQAGIGSALELDTTYSTTWQPSIHAGCGNVVLDDLSVHFATASALRRLVTADPNGTGRAHLLLP
jgi:hypothetical protein